MPDIPGLESKTLEFADGDATVSVLFAKLDCLSAADWLARLGVALAKAGVRSSAGKRGGDVLFQLPNLHYDDVRDLLSRLLAGCQLVREDPQTRKTVLLKLTDKTAADNIKTMECLWRIRWEAFAYNFGFFAEGGSSLFRRLKAGFAPPPSATSTPSSAS